MSGHRRRPDLGPLYSLEVAKRDVASDEYRFMGSVVQRLRADVGDWSDGECYARIRTLVASLAASDFAWVESMRPQAGRVVNADVYGKQDDLGVWFIKFAVREDRTRLFSCHLAEGDMELKSGARLKVMR